MRRASYRLSLIATTLLVSAAFFLSTLSVYENVIFALAPSAVRATTYGERHFDAQRSFFYDIDRAEYWYEKAAQLDPQYPYVNHQLARIEFLKGNFNTAMFYINKEIELHGEEEPNTYYVRGLIEGYMGRYDDAAKDYEHYLSLVPPNWAGINDYAWVLLKAGRHTDAARETEKGLSFFPDNAWILNTSAIALYESGNFSLALERARAAVTASQKISQSEWLTAYPGNDPRVAGEGIKTLQTSALGNMHMIEAALASSTVQ